MEVDCRACENFRLVDEKFPSLNEPVLVRKWCECSVKGEVFLTSDELRRAYIECSQRVVKIGYGIPREILEEIDGINLAISKILGQNVKAIYAEPEVITYVASPCYSRVDFEVKVGALTSLLEMNLDVLKTLLDKFKINYERDEKSLKLMKRLFSGREMLNPELVEALSFLTQVVELRNKLPPYHKPSPEEVRELMEGLGTALPLESSEWQKTSEILLRKFLNALKTLRKALTKIALEG